ncbi:hypothetical protein C8J55DRAFT_555793 [Lentinula edodes]|uniref:Uncharacterized protein n=1 Tax=Lentinula lateritia TaxID=40482 RepID=A0A9W9DZL3_9AGAR|nr:hypothetical protein C8J55DRAFT_555793 [Lentinula edodes]
MSTLNEEEILQYLRPHRREQFKTWDSEEQNLLIERLQACIPFLKHFPVAAGALPPHLLRIDSRILLYFGWIIDKNELCELAIKSFPEAVHRDNNLAPIPGVTTFFVIGRIAEACKLPGLSIQRCRIGPHESDVNHLVLSLASNSNFERQMEELSKEGIDKLKEMVRLQGPPRWFVHHDTYIWPSFHPV